MLHFGRRNVAGRKHNVLVTPWQHHQDALSIHRQPIQDFQHPFCARSLHRQIIEYNQLLVRNFIGQRRSNRQATHLLRHIMMVSMRLWTKYCATMTELWSACAALAGTPRSFLLIWLSTSARYFTARLRRSVSLTAIHQLRGDNLVENRHVRGDSEHLLAQFELSYGLSGHVIHCSRGHFGYLFACFLIMSRPPLAPGTDPLTRSRLRSGSA